ncbi:hypothetical protein A2U01_0010315 [Trifolium medium]|uniref:Uncharacterized protein n=1 Tax=Trifolium medium TaxID=97028 RepID=A0A392MQZ4_9FABA|nr:hypothetical protein [Trifolium medium]
MREMRMKGSKPREPKSEGPTAIPTACGGKKFSAGFGRVQWQRTLDLQLRVDYGGFDLVWYVEMVAASCAVMEDGGNGG